MHQSERKTRLIYEKGKNRKQPVDVNGGPQRLANKMKVASESGTRSPK